MPVAQAQSFRVLANPSEWKYAATVAFVFFVGSLALAPALTRDQTNFASEINAKTLKAAAAATPDAAARRPTLSGSVVLMTWKLAREAKGGGGN